MYLSKKCYLRHKIKKLLSLFLQIKKCVKVQARYYPVIQKSILKRLTVYSFNINDQTLM